MTHQDLIKRNIRTAMNKSEEFSHNCTDGTHKIRYEYMGSSTVVTFEKDEYHVGDFQHQIMTRCLNTLYVGS